MRYKLIDFWRNGYVDVMVGRKLLAEISRSKKGVSLRYTVTIERPDMVSLEQWIQECMPAMVFLMSGAKRA